MAEDILVRLKAEAETTALKKYEDQLGRIADAALKAGKSEIDVHKQLQGIHAKTILDAQKAGKTVGQYLNDVGTKSIKAADGMRRLSAETTKSAEAHHAHGNAISHITRELSAMTAGYLAVHRVVHTVIESFEEFAKFDNSLRKIQNATGQTDVQIRALGQSFTALSKETGKSAEDILEGFQELREGANLTAGQAQHMMRSIATGAQAAQIPVKEMGEAFAAAMRNMQVEGQDVTKVMDQMAMASSHLRLDMAQMAPMIPRLTEAFGEMGYTGEQGTAAMLAWVSALRGVTKNSSEAAMAASRMIEQVSGPGIANALKMPQKEMERIVERAKSEGQDVLSVVTGMIIQRSEFTGQTVNQLLDKMSYRERRYWRAAIENREKVRHADEELAQHSEGTSNRMAANFRKGPQQAIDELTQSWEAFKRKIGESLGKIGVTEGLKATSTDLERIVELMEMLEHYGTYVKALMKDIVQGNWSNSSKELTDAKKAMDEAHTRIGGGYRQRREGGMPDQQRLDESFGAFPGAAQRKGPHGEPVPNWVPNAHKGTYYGGWSGWGGGAATGGAQHFAGGGGFGGGGNTIEGRNWQHDLLGGGTMSSNIEDRRNTDATKANTEALKRLEDILDDVQGVQGGLAGELGIGSIGGGRGMGGRFGGTSGGRVGGGVAGAGSGGSGGVAGAGSGGPGTGIGSTGGGGYDGAIGGLAGTVDRSSLAGQLNEGTVSRLAGLAQREVGSNPEEQKKFIAGHLNRTLIESGNIQHQMDNGYYPGTQHGGYSGDLNAFKQNVLGPVMQGEGGTHTHNASLGVAANAARLYPGYGAKSPGGEYFYMKGSREASKLSRFIRPNDVAPTGGNTAAGNAGGGMPASEAVAFMKARGGHSAGGGLQAGMNPEFAARMAAAGKAFEAETGQKANYGEMDRSEALQAQYYRNFISGGGGRAAPPGRSKHGLATGAEATDVPHGQFLSWLNRGNNSRFGVRSGFMKDDMVHAQMDHNFRGPSFLQNAGSANVSGVPAGTRGTPVQIASVSSDASKSLTEAHGSAIEKATKVAEAGDAEGTNKGFEKEQNSATAKAREAAGMDTSGKPYGEGGFGKSGFGAKHQTGKLDSELDSASGKGRRDAAGGTGGFGRSHFGARHQSGKLDEELGSAAGKKGRGHPQEGASGSPAGLPQQAASFKLDRTQFSRRDRAMDKAAQTALHQASENSHADIGVA